MTDVAAPLFAAFLFRLALPYAISELTCHFVEGLSATDCGLLERLAFPGCELTCQVIGYLIGIAKWISGQHDNIRDEMYLEGRQVENFDPRSDASGRSAQ